MLNDKDIASLRDRLNHEGCLYGPDCERLLGEVERLRALNEGTFIHMTEARTQANKAEAACAAMVQAFGDGHVLHDAIEALGAIRSRLPGFGSDSLRRSTKRALVDSMIGLRQISDEGLGLKPHEQTGSAKVFRIHPVETLALIKGNKS